MITKIPINPSYRKANGLWNLRTDQLPLPKDFEVMERGVVYIPAGEYGGNHKHPRREEFVGIGDDLYIVWIDQDGNKHIDKMLDGEQLFLFDIAPNTPHVVVNESMGFAILVELATGSNINVERFDVLSIHS